MKKRGEESDTKQVKTQRAALTYRTGPEGEIVLCLGTPNPKQLRFCLSRARYTAYGGARGGGKSHILRIKAVGGALRYPGIKVLILRRSFTDLERTLIDPLVALVPPELGTYNASRHVIQMGNGSQIRFGHFHDQSDAAQYQGQEYDWIFIDEATQLTEEQFRTLGACLRGVNDIPKRMYLTCNPGGVGHLWVKRLFLDRELREGLGERPEDYLFIPATVEDNTVMMEKSPEYVRMLDLLPEDIRRAHRYGDWDALAGQYFSEFRRDTHVVAPLRPQEDWFLYRAIDYGLDMFACLWIGVDETGRCYVYREVQQPGLVVSEAARLTRDMTPPEEAERLVGAIAPTDLWSRQKDTGKTMAELFAQFGVPLLRGKGSQSRIQGWVLLKEALKKREDGVPGLLVTEDCRGLIRNLPALQHSDKDPSDCATEPHDITHICDALRYFIRFRTPGGRNWKTAGPEEEAWERGAAYQTAMTGGTPTGGYLGFFRP
ncbi:MAG: phage terminase large subunit [Oscillospiraceae bacterium]